MKQEIVNYPVIMTEYNDESGHYYVVTSPNIPGMVTDGDDIPTALHNTKDAIATMLVDTKYPEIQDPRKWKLENGEQTSWVTVNMTKWLDKYGKTVRRNITLPKGLNEWAKKNKINVSKVTREALYEMQQV